VEVGQHRALADPALIGHQELGGCKTKGDDLIKFVIAFG
jgi:hypothetical protein